MAHYFETTNFIGQPVQHRFVKRIMADEFGEDIWFIRHDVIVNGKGSDTRFIPLDTEKGRNLLAEYCVPLDVLRQEN